MIGTARKIREECGGAMQKKVVKLIKYLRILLSLVFLTGCEDIRIRDYVERLVEGNIYYVYVANSGSNNISAFRINKSSGALTEITGAGSPFGAGIDPTGITIAVIEPWF